MSRHLLIAGTGRAGTSFLVRYMAKLGLQTHLSHAGMAASWNDQGNAGLEDLPLPAAGSLPYVIKSPWTYQYIHQLLLTPTLEFDAVVVPMRDLTEAAASRCIVELQAMHDSLPWMRELSQTWDHFAHTPGGIVYSINPVDQARLLAVGFHQLLDAVVKADIPVVLLSFPRLIEDADYLYQKLSNVLPTWVSMDISRFAHAETADREKVHVGNEIRPFANRPEQGFALSGTGHEHLDRAALRRVLAKISGDLEVVRTQANDAVTAERAAQEERCSDLQAFRITEQKLLAMVEEKGAALSKAVQDLAATNTKVQDLMQERDRMTRQWNQAREALETERSAHEKTQRTLDCIYFATTWQIALRLQRIAKHMAWATPVARWLIRARTMHGPPAPD